MSTPRQIPDSECVQSKCGYTTSGCWNECNLRRFSMQVVVPATVVAQPAAVSVKQMVNRFLGWSLPKTFGPDCGITFDGRKDDEWNKNKTWPTGTNLLTADEAKAMFEYVLATPAEQSTDKPAEG
jgi:hypothetical protein